MGKAKKARIKALKEVKRIALDYLAEVEDDLEHPQNRMPDVGDPHHALGRGFAANHIARRVNDLIKKTK